MMNTYNHREQVEPTIYRATPWLGGGNTQYTTGQSWQRQQVKGKGKPGTLSNSWGQGWRLEGKGLPGKGQRLEGPSGATRALAEAPAALGKGVVPWGGRGRGRGGLVAGVPAGCLAPCPSGLPGNPECLKGKGPTSWSSKGGGAQKGKPGALSNQWGDTWNPAGKGYPGRGHMLGGPSGITRAPAAAPAVVFGKGAIPWGGRGRGWVRLVHQVPHCSSPPKHPLVGEGRAPLHSKGGRATVVWEDNQANGQWQLWKGKPVRGVVVDGNHTIATRNYWGLLRGKGNGKQWYVPQSDPGPGELGSRFMKQGSPGAPAAHCSWFEGRDPAPSSVVSHCATRGG